MRWLLSINSLCSGRNLWLICQLFYLIKLSFILCLYYSLLATYLSTPEIKTVRSAIYLSPLLYKMPIPNFIFIHNILNEVFQVLPVACPPFHMLGSPYNWTMDFSDNQQSEKPISPERPINADSFQGYPCSFSKAFFYKCQNRSAFLVLVIFMTVQQKNWLFCVFTNFHLGSIIIS